MSTTQELKSVLPDISTLVQIPWHELTVDELIGEGGYGAVHRGKWQGINIAIKQLHLKKLPVQLFEDFKQEAALMSKCRFPYVIELYGVCMEINHYAMVMSYLPKGSLYDVLHNPNEDFPWDPLRWDIGIEVGKGLAYLHRLAIVHHDLKSLNILLDNQYHAIITDFGMAKIKLESSSTSTKARQGMGTTRWRAPELFKRGAKPNATSDVYGYGMVLWEIASRKLPFEDAPDDQMVISFIKDGEKENIPTDCPAAYAAEIEKSWLPPDKRPLASDISIALEKAKPPIMEEKPVKSRPSSPDLERSWHFDPILKETAVTDGKPYVLIPATQKDFDRVVSFYAPHPIDGYEIGNVEVIYNPAFNRKFTLHMQTTLQERDNNPEFEPTWPQMSYPNQRQGIMTLFNNLTQPHSDPDFPALKLLPAWHGTRKSLLDSIFRIGYSNLSTTDDGYFGKGLYTTYEAEYAYRVYSKRHGSEGVLILNWVASFSSLPVVFDDMQKLRGKSNYGNFDGHFVPIVPQNPHHPDEIIYFPCKEGQPHQYTEMVVFESSACLPRYVVTLQKSILKSPSSTQPIHQIKNKSVEKDIKNKSVEKDIKNKSAEMDIKNKPVEKDIKNKPVEKDIKNKSAEMDIKNKPVEKDIKNKSAEMDIKNKSVEKDIQNKSAEMDIKNKSVEKDEDEDEDEDEDVSVLHEKWSPHVVGSSGDLNWLMNETTIHLQNFPNSFVAFYYRGLAKRNLGGLKIVDKSDWNEALNLAMKKKETSPNDVDAHVVIAQFHYFITGEFDKAIQYSTMAIQFNPNSAYAYRSRGNSYRMKGEYDKCIDDCSKAIQLNPNYSLAYWSRGYSYCMKTEYDKCIEDCSKAIELNPNYSDAYRSRGESYRMKGDYEKSIDDSSKAIELNPNDSIFYASRGCTYRLMRNTKAAKIDLEQSLKLDPNNVFAKNELKKLK